MHRGRGPLPRQALELASLERPELVPDERIGPVCGAQEAQSHRVVELLRVVENELSIRLRDARTVRARVGTRADEVEEVLLEVEAGGVDRLLLADCGAREERARRRAEKSAFLPRSRNSVSQAYMRTVSSEDTLIVRTKAHRGVSCLLYGRLRPSLCAPRAASTRQHYM